MRRGKLLKACGGALGAAAVLLATLAPAPARADGWPRPERTELSQPGVESWFAPINHPTFARVRPHRGARKVLRLGYFTQEGTPEVVALLRRTTDSEGRNWFEVRLPARPAGRTGWVLESSLGGPASVDTWLTIDLRRLRARLVRSGRTVFRSRIGVGKPQWPTPRGQFYIRSKLTGFGSSPVYGPVAFGTNATSPTLTDWPGGGFIGIHGTGQPGLLPGRVSHGCVRMRNRDILRLARLMPVGTPVTIG